MGALQGIGNSSSNKNTASKCVKNTKKARVEKTKRRGRKIEGKKKSSTGECYERGNLKCPASSAVLCSPPPLFFSFLRVCVCVCVRSVFSSFVKDIHLCYIYVCVFVQTSQRTPPPVHALLSLVLSFCTFASSPLCELRCPLLSLHPLTKQHNGNPSQPSLIALLPQTA
jgi:hypothetical protein